MPRQEHARARRALSTHRRSVATGGWCVRQGDILERLIGGPPGPPASHSYRRLRCSGGRAPLSNRFGLQAVLLPHLPVPPAFPCPYRPQHRLIPFRAAAVLRWAGPGPGGAPPGPAGRGRIFSISCPSRHRSRRCSPSRHRESPAAHRWCAAHPDQRRRNGAGGSPPSRTRVT